jgi:predicted esterase
VFTRALPLVVVASCLAFTGFACSSTTTSDTSPEQQATPDAAPPADAATTVEPPAHTTPDAALLPKVTGTCPAFAQGKATFAPSGIQPREVMLTVSDAAKTKDGPLVFFWHGTGGDPSEAGAAFSSTTMKELLDAGGIVAAPYHDDAAGQLPWFLSLGGDRDDDLKVMDEVLACAIRDLGVDTRRVYAAGFSAGAMNAMQVAVRRSGYIASIVSFSGSYFGDAPAQDPKNLYPAMLFYGGPQDKVLISFEEGSKNYKTKMTEAGHFVFLCNHGKGHTVPLDARASAWQFLQDHPFGVRPEPYAKGLPEGFPGYCEL